MHSQVAYRFLLRDPGTEERLVEQPAGTRATLTDVAREAQVSLKTASRALAGEPHVTPSTRARVVAAASALGYERNAAASLLASGRRSDTVGFITGDLSNPFYSALASGVEAQLGTPDLRLSVASSDESPEREWALAQSFAAARVSALVIASAMREHSSYAALVAQGLPIVFVDRRPEGIDADAVVFDDVAGGRLAAAHLLRAGHLRIGFIGDYEWLPTSRGRLQGLEAELAASGTGASVVAMGAHDAAAAAAFAADMLSGRDAPTAIIAGNNRIMLGVATHLRGTTAARRPALIGFDDFEWADVVGATVVTGDAEQMGREAARRVIAQLGTRDRRPEVTVLPMALYTRGSGELSPER